VIRTRRAINDAHDWSAGCRAGAARGRKITNCIPRNCAGGSAIQNAVNDRARGSGRALDRVSDRSTNRIVLAGERRCGAGINSDAINVGRARAWVTRGNTTNVVVVCSPVIRTKVEHTDDLTCARWARGISDAPRGRQTTNRVAAHVTDVDQAAADIDAAERRARARARGGARDRDASNEIVLHARGRGRADTEVNRDKAAAGRSWEDESISPSAGAAGEANRISGNLEVISWGAVRNLDSAVGQAGCGLGPGGSLEELVIRNRPVSAAARDQNTDRGACRAEVVRDIAVRNQVAAVIRRRSGGRATRVNAIRRGGGASGNVAGVNGVVIIAVRTRGSAKEDHAVRGWSCNTGDGAEGQLVAKRVVDEANDGAGGAGIGES